MPLLTRPPIPEITPAKPVERLSPPTVRMALPSLTNPPPESPPTVWLKLARSKTAPRLTATAPAAGIAATTPVRKTPEATVVPPK